MTEKIAPESAKWRSCRGARKDASLSLKTGESYGSKVDANGTVVDFVAHDCGCVCERVVGVGFAVRTTPLDEIELFSNFTLSAVSARERRICAAAGT